MLNILRRVLILIVSILFIASLLLYFQAGRAIKINGKIPAFYNLYIYSLNKDIVIQLERSLKKDGYFVQFIKEKGFKQKVDGYLVLQDFPNEEHYKSVIEVLKNKGLDVKKVESPKPDRVLYQIGGVYSSREAAQRQAYEAAVAGVKFKVEYHYKNIPVILDCLIVNKLKKEKLDELKQNIDAKYKNKITFKAMPATKDSDD